jgi:hypothetical protein
MKQRLFHLSALLLFLITFTNLNAQSKTIWLSLQTRDTITGQAITHREYADPSKTGIIIIDPWNYHWCMTWTEQVGGMATRINLALQAARKLGMTVLWAPTDVAGMYSGWPQRQRAMSVPYIDVPAVRSYTCHFTVPTGQCLCGPGIDCKVNYGWDGMDPHLEIAPEDLIVCGTKELYSLCRARGITRLIYFGGATNICVSGKPEGLTYMYGAGLETIFARDMAFAWTSYNPDKSYTPSRGNEQAADDLERAGIPTIRFVEELQKMRLWNESRITEPVRITPAGTVNRPYFFEQKVTATLETPYLRNDTIRFTLDGSEPSVNSARYEHPLVLTQTTTLRTAAFRKGKKISLDSRAFFVLLPPVPPEPEIFVSNIEPVADLYAAIGPVYAACLWNPVADRNYEGKTLRIREQSFAKGLGMRAPAYFRLNLDPTWKRFVARAGVDDHLLDENLGRNVARYPAIIFKVFIDGRLVAQSPVMRISQEPWRFNVPIPAGSRQLTLVCDDAGNHNPYNLGNWVDAGFCKE